MASAVSVGNTNAFTRLQARSKTSLEMKTVDLVFDNFPFKLFLFVQERISIKKEKRKKENRPFKR